MLNSHCFSASFTPLNPPGLLPQWEAADDGREFIPSTRGSEWALSLHYDVFAEKRSLCNFTIMPKITFWVWYWFVCTQHLLVGMFHKYALLTAHFLAHTLSSGRPVVIEEGVCVRWRWGWGGGFPCIFESLILQVITQQCKLQRGSKEPWPLPALAWPCMCPSCLTLQLTA